MGSRSLEDVVVEVLDIPPASVTDELAFGAIPEWDSLRHVELMLALEEYWQIRIDADLVLKLTSVRAIRQFAGRRRHPSARPAAEDSEGPAVNRGLSGVYVDNTSISHIDGVVGLLTYRGYPIDDLVRNSSFEETVYLLLHGDLPTPGQLRALDGRLRAGRAIPDGVRDVLVRLRRAPPIDALRTAVSSLSSFDPERGDRSPEGMARAGIRLIAQVPTIVAEHHAMRDGREPARRSESLPHAANILSGLARGRPSVPDAERFERVLILLAEHGSNASAFAARVVIGTGGDLHGALTAALGAFAGPLHGGAVEGVMEMVEAIGEPSRAASYVRALRDRKQPVLGLGHRLYRTEDPRARLLRAMARDLSSEASDMTPFLILEEVRKAMHPHTRFGVDVNVDFYAGLVFSLLGIPSELHTPTFAAARVAGWVAHVLEQVRNNVLIRPLLRYVGGEPRRYTTIEEREAPGRTIEASERLPVPDLDRSASGSE